MRLDRRLVDIGAFESRAKAQAAIRAGKVRVDGSVAAKPAADIPDTAQIEIEGPAHPYVSRGGVKLAAALDAFSLDPAGRVCLDLGASTGGFTEVLLRRGAARVYAVDVGAAQLHARIAADPRVVNLEKTHARDLTPAVIPTPPSLIVCDVSFISLKKALPPALALAAPEAALVALVKPQFEVGPAHVGRGGVVRDAQIAQDACDGIARWLAGRGWAVTGAIDSPILGGEGNREFLIGARRRGGEEPKS
ncbi:MAG: TlyA family rRNA (cytidine-2'-O)-methyltransferase [Parvularculaceae bacterium]